MHTHAGHDELMWFNWIYIEITIELSITRQRSWSKFGSYSPRGMLSIKQINRKQKEKKLAFISTQQIKEFAHYWTLLEDNGEVSQYA